MKVENFVRIIGADFYTGVPDSQLKALCDYLMYTYGINPQHHIIAANEGNCVGLAAGYHLATGKIPVVYLQNSGEGNIINPTASLLNEKVYAIPTIFIIGWRGEPSVKDEPQHIFQGKITLKLLEDMEIQYFIIEKETTEKELSETMREFRYFLSEGKQVAFVIRKASLEFEKKCNFGNEFLMHRESIIKHIVHAAGDDIIVSTTGKASRELFEIREADNTGHDYDFLTVGSMGHSSSIALGIALNKPRQKIWCIDGDGAALMHMGAMAVIGSCKPQNLIHIIINNGSHETVGGQPTVASVINLSSIAEGCGYTNVMSVSTFDELDNALIKAAKSNQLTFIEAKSAIGARANLGRPTTTTHENKEAFMKMLQDS